MRARQRHQTMDALSQEGRVSIAKVEPVTRDRIMISLSPGYRSVSFRLQNGGAEIVIVDAKATETTRFAVAPPKVGQALDIIHTDETMIEVVYRSKDATNPR